MKVVLAKDVLRVKGRTRGRSGTSVMSLQGLYKGGLGGKWVTEEMIEHSKDPVPNRVKWVVEIRFGSRIVHLRESFTIDLLLLTYNFPVHQKPPLNPLRCPYIHSLWVPPPSVTLLSQFFCV